MDAEKDIWIVKQAIRDGLVTRKQVQRCMKKRKTQGLTTSLSNFLVEVGYLTREDLQELQAKLQEQEENQAPGSSFTLTIMTGPPPLVGREFKFQLESTSIGTHPDNNIVLPDPQISRHHAIIESAATGLCLRDLGSRNGTYLNDQKISKAVLQSGDIIQIGSFRLQIDFAHRLNRKIVIVKRGKRFPVKKQVIRIGRHPQCEIHFPEPIISREHACIQADAQGNIVIADQGSNIGTLVQGRLIKNHVLHDGDRVVIGFHKIVISMTSDMLYLTVGRLKNEDEIALVKSFINRGKFIPRLFHVPLLQEWPRDRLRELINSLETIQLPVGTEVVTAGEFRETFFMLLQGTAEGIPAQADPDSERPSFAAGDLLGHEPLLCSQPTPMNIKITAPAQLLVFPRQRLRALAPSECPLLQPPEPATIEQLLAPLPLFQRLSAEELAQVAQITAATTVTQGQIIATKGKKSLFFYYLRSGHVAAMVKKNVLFYYRPGEYFASRALYQPAPHPYTLKVTSEQAELLKIKAHDFRRRCRDICKIVAQSDQPAGPRTTESTSQRLVRVIQQCTDCATCMESCREIRGTSRMSHQGPNVGSYQVITACYLCHDPRCLLCPFPGAIFRYTRERVTITDQCLGCGLCKSQCPWGVITIGPSTPGEHDYRALVCDQCAGSPVCVEQCPTQALKLVPLRSPYTASNHPK